jgi:hypothetical protein
MIEVEGMINNQPVAILINSIASLSYIDLNLVERFNFLRSKQGKYWLVQLDTRYKRRINELLRIFQWTLMD